MIEWEAKKRMNDRWKDIFIIITLGALAVLSTITIIELFLVKTLRFDETITIGFIGAILGGTLSGAITLIGVNKTIQENRRKDNDETLPRKIVNANHFIGQASSVLLTTQFNLDAMKGKYLKNEDLSKFNAVDAIEAHSRIREKIHEFVDNAINDSALNVSYEVYENVIIFSNEFEKIKSEISEITSEYNLNCILGREDEKQTLDKIIDGVDSYVKIIKNLVFAVENEKATNLNMYKQNKTL